MEEFMSADINSIVLVGRLTRDAELKYTNPGIPVSRLGLAVNRKKKVNNQWVEEANFFDIIVWGKIAEVLQPYLTKGKQICVQGELRQNRWEKDGKPQSRVEVIATNIQLLGTGTGQTQNNPPPPQSSPSRSQSQGNVPVDNFEDDIPF
jgi:single-strand DNA-binding protein